MVAVAVVCVIAAMFVADVGLLWAMFWMENSDYSAMTATQWQTHQTWTMLLAGTMIGTFASQLFLAVLFAAMGDGSSARRILYTTFGVAIFTNLLVLFSMWLFETPRHELVGGFLIPMLFFYLLQLPFWGVRSYFGWIITSPWAVTSDRVRLRFTLIHLLGWSVFLAIPLCILQGIGDGPFGPDPEVFCLWAVLLTALLMWLLYTSLAATTPGWRRISAATLGILVAVAIQVATVWIWEGGRTVEPFIAIGVANACGGAVVVACLALARWLGYRLLPFAARLQQ